MTVGDAPRAARVAAQALEAGASRVDELRHPERAAAWLRARVVASVGRAPADAARRTHRLRALETLGADAAVMAGLAALRRDERAALVASSVERLDARDVATIVGRGGGELDRLLARARRRYAAAHSAAVAGPRPDGPIVDRIREVAARAMS